MNIEYKSIETNFTALICSLSPNFTSQELNEIREFIEHGEYGLALDTVIDIIKEENKKIDTNSFNLLVKLSNSMRLDLSVVKAISGHVF